MAKNFLAGPTLKAQGQRNGFDVSYQNQFTVPFGMLLPCFFQRVNPDDKVDIALESQTICDGLARPAFMRLKEHVDYYFIPTTQLWMPFDNFVTGQNSYFSSSVKNVNEGKVPDQVPTFVPAAIAEYVDDWNTNNIKDELGYDFNQGVFRLLDALGYWNFSAMTPAQVKSALENDTTSPFNLFPLLCYQKVYYDFYRNSKYEDNDVQAYNIDDLSSGFRIVQLADLGVRFKKFFEIHYRWQKKDYFTEVQPSNLVTSSDYGYTDLSAVPLAAFLNIPGIPASTNTRSAVVGSPGTPNLGVSVFAATGAQTNTSTNVSAIRFAFAYDRLLRRMRQAGPDFDSQMLAQFGVKPFDARHGKCTYLGGYTNSLSSKDVTNMTGDDIGDLAGQINVYSDNTKRHLKYHAKEHGYIIGIYSTSVENLYQSYRLSREVQLRSRFDWFNSAFENLGLQPVFQCEYDYTDEQAAIRGMSYRPQSRTEILGYVPRYSELKTRPDECHGLLCNYSNVVGFREWNVQVNTEIQRVGSALSKPMLQLNPAQFDPVSGLEYDGTQFKDHFIVNMYTHSKKVSSMTVFEEF